MLNLQGYGLVRNPFNTLASDFTHWSGRDRERKLLQEVVRNVSYDENQLSEFVILVGDWGSGKTHALGYVTEEAKGDDREPRIKAIMVTKVKVGPKVRWLDLYGHIVKQHLGLEFFEDLSSRFREIVQGCARDVSATMSRKAYEAAIEKDTNHFINEVIDSLSDEDRPYGQLLWKMSDGDEAAYNFVMRGGKVPGGIDLPEKITTDYDAIQVLTGILRIMTVSVMEAEPIYRAVQVGMDEMEELLEAKAAEQAEFWYGTRELINRVPRQLALFMAFSSVVPMLEAMIPQAVMERRTRRDIVLEALTPGEAKQFVVRQLAHHRPEDGGEVGEFHPFSERAVDYVLEQTVPLVPRRILLAFRQVLNAAIRRQGLVEGEEISGKMAEKIIEDLGI